MNVIRETLARTVSVKGQHLVEITILVGLAALVFIAMQVYIQRGIQGKTRFLTDRIIGDEQRAYTATTATSASSTNISGRTRVVTGQFGSTSKTIVNERVVADSSSYAKDKRR